MRAGLKRNLPSLDLPSLIASRARQRRQKAAAGNAVGSCRRLSNGAQLAQPMLVTRNQEVRQLR